MNNIRNSKQCSRLSRCVKIQPYRWTYILCFILLPLYLLNYVTGSARADSGSELQTKTTGNPSVIQDISAEQSIQQLYKEDISPLKEEKDTESKIELLKVIRQIQAIELPHEESSSQKTITEKQKPAAEPNKTASPDLKKQNIEPAAGRSISFQTLEMLSGMIKEQQKIHNPAELAEILFLDGKLQEAASMYQEALKLAKPQDPEQTANRSWFLFQAANCLRDSDISQAAKLYDQLVKEYPDSPWTELAKTQNKIVLWYQKDNPDKIITEIRQQKTKSLSGNINNEPNK
jgi:tetratricopeptide (TPR) repeat protein